MNDPRIAGRPSRRTGERRRLFDRRSPASRRSGLERRRGDRRASSASHAVSQNRRTGADRRNDDRRHVPDRRGAPHRRVGPRRRVTPTPYGVQEFAQVRDILARKNAAAECPACGSAFALGRPRPRGNEVVRQVRCLGCGRTAVVTNTWAARVLVVEANDVVRDTLRAILTGDGHDVVEAADAAVGLQAFRVTPSDVVFVDVLASGRMEAADFVRRLRREFPDARVVALSRRPSYGVTDRGAVTTQLGAVRTIRMPFSRAEVLEAVAEARR